MYRAEDYKAGKGLERKKPKTSILPYLKEREKAREVEENAENTNSKMSELSSLEKIEN